VAVRRLLALIAMSALVVAGCGSSGSDGTTSTPAIKNGATKEISGPWTGKLAQSGLAPFQIAVLIGPDGTGRVAYTGIECGGRWTLKRTLASSPPAGYTFRETITQGVGGECKGIGEVGIGPHPPGDPETLGYAFTGGGVSSKGTLHKTGPARLKPVFDEAGVTPP
jgi:hypothetical protein